MIATLVLAGILTAPIAHAQTPSDKRKQWLETKPPITGPARLALVIGNAHYEGGNELDTPGEDAQALAQALQSLGFNVMLRLDRSNKEMLEDIHEFHTKIEAAGPATLALFYYSGHGAQVSNANYLIPIGFSLTTENDIVYDALPAQRVLDEMGGAKSRIVILDACRNNPFIKYRSLGSKGLAQMHAPSGTFIAYATAPGDTAPDTGIFRKELMERLQDTDSAIGEVFRETGAAVVEKTHGSQVPWQESSLTERVVLKMPTSPQSSSKIYATRGEKALAEKNYIEAERWYRLALDGDSDNGTYHFELGDALCFQSKFAEAEPHFKEAIREMPGSYKRQFYLGSCLVMEKKFAEAVPIIKEAVRLKPEYSHYHMYLSEALVNSNSFLEAETEAREALRLDSKNAWASFYLGRALASQNKYVEAEPEYRRALRSLGQEATVHNFLGTALYQQDKYVESEAEYREAIRLNPNYGQAHANLACALYSQNKLEEAKISAQKAIDLGYKTCWVYETLGIKL